ncbi:hypothetical protein [Aurantiacibacter poecillastricola]|uniref:hypothetical protein n=1 Tax=Aurantiacibacter poecillastricola TaxID=3064385 RepID=UPI00273E6FF1|nr:hypothetical protein [Aurantiacibacter sp. 219JJ12-13]MDP5262174.1 hypothetical protein [Aurantiacibacter sp. 219JJ12-13]
MTRALSIILLPGLLLACSESGDSLPPEGTAIECALDGGSGFGPGCTMERVSQDGESFVVVRHPDGAFRRFQLGVPGRGLVTADGADQAEVTNHGSYVEVRVGSDRYRLPIAG